MKPPKKRHPTDYAIHMTSDLGEVSAVASLSKACQIANAELTLKPRNSKAFISSGGFSLSITRQF